MCDDRNPLIFARGELNLGVPCTDHLVGPAYKFVSLDDTDLQLFFWLALSFIYPLIRQCQMLAGADATQCDNLIEDETHRLSILYLAKAGRCLPNCGKEGTNAWGIFNGVLAAPLSS